MQMIIVLVLSLGLYVYDINTDAKYYINYHQGYCIIYRNRDTNKKQLLNCVDRAHRTDGPRPSKEELKQMFQDIDDGKSLEYLDDPNLRKKMKQTGRF